MLQQNLKNTELGKIPIEWELESFENIAVNKGLIRGPFGGALKKEMFKPSGYKVYEQQNAIYQSIDLGNYFIDQQKYSELKRFAVKANDFILSCSGTIGKLYHIPNNFKEGVINQALLLIRLDSSKIDYKYFENQFNSNIIQNKILDVQGGAMKNLVGMDQIRKVKFIIPSLPEQKAIANCLSTWDDAIEKQTKLIAAKEQRKKALMQQLLSGKKRLPGFTEAWKEVSIKEISSKKSSILQSNALVENSGSYKIYGATGVLTFVDFYEEENRYIGIVKDGSGVGNLFLCDGKSSVIATLDKILPKKNIDLDFLYQLFQTLHFGKYIVGGAIPHIYFRDYSNIHVNLPPELEQRAIGEFLKNVDLELNLLRTKLMFLKKQKVALMQQLLTAKVRLVS